MEKAAREAAKLLMRCYGRLKQNQIRSKSLNDYVTVVDKKSEKIIVKILNRSYPHYGVLGEEGGLRGTGKMRWVIDPLDGTSNYIHQFPMFCISIALSQSGVPVAGLILDPVHDELFTAVKGGGAFLNGRPISVSPTRKLIRAFIATGFPYRMRKFFEPYNESLRRLFYRTSAIRRGGSAALDLCYTACGRTDAFWEFGLSEWDIAAGGLIVEEAGGIVTDFKGKRNYLDSGNVAAGNPPIHRSLIAILKPIKGFGEFVPAPGA